MSKKIIDESFESVPDPTKPVRTGRKIFKDNPEPETTKPVNTAGVEKTVPVKIKAKKAKPATESTSSEDLIISDAEDVSAEEAKPKKVRHWGWFWLGILAMLIVAAIGAGVGYASAMKIRMAEETNQRLEIATTQYVMAEQDQQNGNLDMARQRLEYILTIYPEYPGLDTKLAEVMVAISLANPQTTTPQAPAETAAAPVPTKDTGQVSVLFNQAQNQYAASDWSGLLDTVNKMRDIDPTYKPIEVDGFYYYALRYNGISKIQSGHLEVGLYYFSMAEQIAPLDVDVESWRNFARMYLIAGSWFGADWAKSAELFYTVSQDVPNMIDSSGYNAKQRYGLSLAGIGDNYMLALDYCNAAIQYNSAKEVYAEEELAAKITQAEEYCANPPATPTPTIDPNAPTPTPGP